MKVLSRVLMGCVLMGIFSSCEDPSCEEEGLCSSESGLTVPTTYAFVRDGSSSVSYSGQTERLNQLGEIKALLSTASQGTSVSASELNAMFENTDGNGGGNFSFNSTKQLANKTFELDTAWYYQLFKDVANMSDSGAAGVQAAQGKGGLITRGSKGSTILVNDKGQEFTQLIEKGMMGSTFLYQIYNNYLTDDKIGPAVDNTVIAGGKNYTDREHHFDEAFGYFGAPIDFESGYTGTQARYWASYSSTTDALTENNSALMNAFLQGRASIEQGSDDSLDLAVAIIYDRLEKVVAAAAIHYLNDAITAADDGDRLHVLSEAYAFTRALKFSPFKALTNAQITELLDVEIGEDFWAVTATGLGNAKATIASAYGYESIADEL